MGINEHNNVMKQIEELSVVVEDLKHKASIERAINRISGTMLGISIALIITRIGGLL